eukprot:sb/3474976/
MNPQVPVDTYKGYSGICFLLSGPKKDQGWIRISGHHTRPDHQSRARGIGRGYQSELFRDGSPFKYSMYLKKLKRETGMGERERDRETERRSISKPPPSLGIVDTSHSPGDLRARWQGVTSLPTPSLNTLPI